jgi:hypothetical protein
MIIYICDCKRSKELGAPRLANGKQKSKFCIVPIDANQICSFCRHYAVKLFVDDNWTPQDGIKTITWYKERFIK